ncbi:MAG: discoidin domain-containing protein [Ketobacteraceae bacterium]|nr:discoidin domain-containing protein [Ketobacteraceae bacterium]
MQLLKSSLFFFVACFLGAVAPSVLAYPKVSASDHDGHMPENVLDGSREPESRWSAFGDGQWIKIDMGREESLSAVDIAFHKGDVRLQYFAIKVAGADEQWKNVFSGASSGYTLGFQRFKLGSSPVRYVMIVGHGTSTNDWNSLTEVRLVKDTTVLESGKSYYVSPNGSDSYSGTSARYPKRTIQKALDLARAGDRIVLADGHYYQNVQTIRDGGYMDYITIEGSENAVVHGDGRGSRVIQINHDYIELNGFTVDGMVNDGRYKSDYRDILIWIHGTQPYRGPEHVLIRNMKIQNAGGECLRLRYFVKYAEIANNEFRNCGIYDFVFGAGGKNGEAIYVGTSSNQWADGKNPTADPDVSAFNHIHNNYFLTNGNECVDIKEGSEKNLVEYNECSGQMDPNSGGFDARGDYNIFRYNISHSNRGAGVRLGGHEVKGHQYGARNDVYGNQIYNNASGAIKFQTDNQRYICGNITASNLEGDSTGTYAGNYDPAFDCSF